MVNNMIKLQFQSIPENEALARTVAAAYVAPLDPTLEEITEIKTGVSEAVSNAIIHGYGENPEGLVVMECSSDEKGGITIAIEDFGVGIENITEAMQPLFTTGKSEERAGMGFTVMESFMDRVDVESQPGKGTKVTLYKQLDLGNER